jgi:hypothetical protein
MHVFTVCCNLTLRRRFMIGFGLTFAANAAPLLVTELAYPSHRAVLTSTYNSLWLVNFFDTCVDW